MKRWIAFLTCAVLCCTLLSACSKPKKQLLPNVDINAPTHTLAEFPDGDIHCCVTLKDLTVKSTDSDGETSVGSAVGEPSYQLDGQAAVDLYNLMKRGEWITLSEATATDAESRPEVINSTLVTLDFYSGKTMEKADNYFGTFQFSQLDMVFVTSNPYDVGISAMVMPVGTCEAILKFAQEKGTKIE